MLILGQKIFKNVEICILPNSVNISKLSYKVHVGNFLNCSPKIQLYQNENETR